MIEPGTPVPDALVWPEPRVDALQLREAVAGDGLALLCFYPFDWSPG